MRFLRSDKTIVRVLIVLAIAQVVGWGTISLPAVIGRQVAADLQMTITAVFAGNSVLYVSMGLWAPPLAKAFISLGARRVMIVGASLAAPGFALLATAQGPIQYFSAWAILGTAGSATLTTAAYIMLNEIAGRNARSAIGALMLVTGLSSSIFWPTTAFLSDAIGWRTTCLIYAVVMIVVCVPLYAFGLPRRAARQEVTEAPSVSTAATTPRVHKTTFYLVTSAIALNAFVTFGFSAVLIELLKAQGLPPTQAIAFGSTLGVIQVSARGIDFLGGARWDGITTGFVAGIALTSAMLLLMVSGGTTWSIAAFIVLYGLGSGAFTVARATIPLVFYDKADYAKAASQIALPLNVMSALSPPVLVGLLTHVGSHAVLGLAALCSCGVLLILHLLSRRRPASDAVAAS